MNITYRKFTPQDHDIIADLVKNLYTEDPSDKMVTPEKIYKTFNELGNHPDKGTIIVLERSKEIIGYAILVCFWSNEWGGNIVIVDELYVKPEYRNQGAATVFFKFLIDNKFNNAVALQLEVTLNNEKARRLYERIGFQLHKNNIMVMEV